MTTVFVSWSGERSKEIGEAIKIWLSGVIQVVRPYFTPTDMDKGARWSTEIREKLIESKFGIFIITAENLNSSWLHFEAGAISNSIGKTSVYPLLFGVDATDLSGPLAQFQATKFTKEEARKLISDLNETLEDKKLPSDVVSRAFDVWWPDLESKISEILKKNPNPEKIIRPDRELIEEILSILRDSNKTDYERARKFAGEALLSFIESTHEQLFLKLTNIASTERQIRMIKRLEAELALELEIDKENSLKIEKILLDARKSLTSYLEVQKKQKAADEDDIPF